MIKQLWNQHKVKIIILIILLVLLLGFFLLGFAGSDGNIRYIPV